MNITLGKIISALENDEIPLSHYFFGFVFIIFIRHFIENFSQIHNKLNDAPIIIAREFIHFVLSYTTLAIFLIFLIHYAAQVPVKKIMRVVLPGFIVLWLNPLIDILFSWKTGVVLSYLQPGLVKNMIYSYFTFFGGFFGATFGLKCEVFIALTGIFFYLRVKKLSVLLSLFYVWAVYSIIFLWGATPYFIQFVQALLGFPYHYSGEMMIHFYLFINFFLLFGIFYLINPKLTRIIANDMRIPRILHYELMICLGAAIALVLSAYDIWPTLYFSRDIIINIILSMMSLFFACLQAITVNNIADIEIDKISNKHRPLVKNEIDFFTYQQLGFLFLALAFFYAAMVNGKVFLLIGVFIAAYYLYSVPPFRLKRIFLFSKLAISLNSIALILLGYLLVNGNLYDFPKVLFFIFLIGVTLSANFIDLKDIAGDKAAGIMTLPVLLQEKTAKLLIGIAFWATYLSFYYFIPNQYFLLLLCVTGGIQFYLINRTPYSESLVLYFYNLSIFILILYLLLLKPMILS